MLPVVASSGAADAGVAAAAVVSPYVEAYAQKLRVDGLLDPGGEHAAQHVFFNAMLIWCDHVAIIQKRQCFIIQNIFLVIAITISRG